MLLHLNLKIVLSFWIIIYYSLKVSNLWYFSDHTKPLYIFNPSPSLSLSLPTCNPFQESIFIFIFFLYKYPCHTHPQTQPHFISWSLITPLNSKFPDIYYQKLTPFFWVLVWKSKKENNMVESAGARQHQNLVFDVSINVPPPVSGSKCFDDDGKLKRTGISFLFFIFFLHFKLQSFDFYFKFLDKNK